MTVPGQALIHPDRQSVADAAGGMLIEGVVEAVAVHGVAHVALTGGSMGSLVLASVHDHPAATRVDWNKVHFWWGDERFLPTGDPDRNETGNRVALLDDLDIEPTNIHPIAGPGSDGITSADESARKYAVELAGLALPGDRSPVFDVVLLGVGPDGHIASLFPGRSELTIRDRSTAAVTGSPKPPPTRVTLTLPTLRSARAVLFVVSGPDKATAVRRGIEGDDVARTPAAGVLGLEQTWWLVDEAAASELPRTLRGGR